MDPLGHQDALIVIDVQRKYAAGDGPFAIADGPALVGRIAAFADTARQHGSPVIWVTRERRPGVAMGPASEAAYVGEVDWFHGPHAELDDRLGALPNETRIVKPRQSSFYGTDLEGVLRGLGISRVVLAGVTTNICVQATAQDARARDLPVVVPSDLTACLPVKASGYELTADQVQHATLATLAHAVGTVCPSADLVAG
jgi:nicotinamidase-related amidase